MQMSQISFHRRDAETQRLRREVQVSWVMADRSVRTEHRDESKAVIATGIRSRAYQAVEKAVWQWFLCAELRASAALRRRLDVGLRQSLASFLVDARYFLVVFP